MNNEFVTTLYIILVSQKNLAMTVNQRSIETLSQHEQLITTNGF